MQNIFRSISLQLIIYLTTLQKELLTVIFVVVTIRKREEARLSLLFFDLRKQQKSKQRNLVFCFFVFSHWQM